MLRALPRFAAAVAVSDLEADELREIGRTRVELIPTGVDTRVLRPARRTQEGPPRLLFTGTMSYAPNHQGHRAGSPARSGRWCAREVPDARLDVVGKDPPRDLSRSTARDGITVHGFVRFDGAVLRRADAVVVPIRTGAGIRVKIIEAMSAGRAMVSTPLGCEGLQARAAGRHLLVATSPPAFARAAVRLLRDPELRARIAADARALAEGATTGASLGDQLEARPADVARRR